MEKKRKKDNAERYIRTIAELKSLSAAAENLGITQPALSTFLKKLENDLGAAIFDRSGQPLELTAEGKLYLDYLEKENALHRQMMQNISDIHDLKTGSVTIGGASFFNTTILPGPLAEYYKAYPGIELEIVDGTVPDLVKMALNGTIDLFVTPDTKRDDRFCYEEILEEKIFLCAPEGTAIPVISQETTPDGINYKIIGREGFRALSLNTYIVLKESQDIGRRLDALFVKYDCEPERQVRAQQTMTTFALSLAGLGVSMITESSIRNWSSDKAPELYHINDDLCRRKICIAYPKNKYLSLAADKLISIVKEHFQ